MGFFDKTRGVPAPAVPAVSSTWLQWPAICPGARQDVIGEGHYQDTLEHVAGGRRWDGFHKLVTAQLVREPRNPHDPNAVRVDLDGRCVGYIPRGDAPRFHPLLAALQRDGRPATARGRITGGWDRGPTDRGHFGIVLDIHDRIIQTPQDLPFLPHGKSVTVAKVAECQPAVDQLCPDGSARALTAQLTVLDDDTVLVWVSGQRVGKLTPAKSIEFAGMVRAAIEAGFPTTCQAMVAAGKTRVEMKLQISSP